VEVKGDIFQFPLILTFSLPGRRNKPLPLPLGERVGVGVRVKERVPTLSE